MGNVIHKGKGSFTVVENSIFFDHGLTAKAKGIYCQIRSLENNPEWIFTIRGFASLVKDGVDAVTAGIKELETAGYIIRARKRSENGRFLKAEEATWVTLDDPAQHAQAVEELQADGFAVLSEFDRSRAGAGAGYAGGMPPTDAETAETGETCQFRARTGKSVSGKATSGNPEAINYSSDKKPDSDKEPLSCEAAKDDSGKVTSSASFTPYRKGEFPEKFERLCAMSLKAITSIKFKRDCLKAWNRQIASGFTPQQITDAYAAYSKSYWMRNGDDNSLAKNLARWLEGEDGLAAYADEPIPPDLFGADGEPLPMGELAKADPDFAHLWRKVETRRCVLRSLVYSCEREPTEETVLKSFESDEPLTRYMAACEERYGRYLKLCEMFGHTKHEDQREGLGE